MLSLANMLHYFISSSYELPAALPAAFSLLYIIRQKGVLNKMNKPNENGRSMIEMLGVLAIIGVLSVGGIAGYSKAMTKFKINKTIDQISQIATNVRTLYAQQKDFYGLNSITAIEMGVIPDDMSTTNSGDEWERIKNVFGGRVDIYGYKDSFELWFWGLTKEGCMAIATADWGKSSSTGLSAMMVNHLSGAVGWEDSEGGYSGLTLVVSSKNFPIPPAKAAQYCGHEDGNYKGHEVNGIAMKFTK